MEWKVRISPNVCEALGVKLYSTLPPVINELISNAYDADATQVDIIIDNNSKEIICIDNGSGMSCDDILDRFLVISKDRRKVYQSELSPKYNRKITGRKGLGKLSVFGICKVIEVETIKDNLLNSFRINYDDLIKMNENEAYVAEKIEYNKNINEPNGTKITLKNLVRKTDIALNALAYSCAKRSNFFSDNFRIIFKDKNNIKNTICIDENVKKELVKKDEQFRWNIPSDLINIVNQDTYNYLIKNNINGFIATTLKPIQESPHTDENYKGIALYARNKLCEEPNFFGVGTNQSHAFSYMHGEINVDFIDEEKDNISTYRGKLVWNSDELEILKQHLVATIKAIGKDWKEKRNEEKIKQIQEDRNICINDWYKDYPVNEQKLAKKITDLVLDSDTIDLDVAINLIDYVEGAFKYQTFKDFAEMLEEQKINNSTILKLLKDWEAVEAKEFYRLCIGRIKIIDKFDTLINSDTLEVVSSDDTRDSMHNFLKTFPWLLEPRLSSMEDEVTYYKLLRDNFTEPDTDTINRRIDFLCKSANGDLYIIEIKRSQKIINKKDLDQLRDYCEFIKEQFSSNSDRSASFNNIKGYIIGKDLDPSARTRAADMANSNKFFLKYSDMLAQARKYHQEFIDTYESLKQSLLKENV